MKKTLLIALSLLAAFGLKAQPKSTDVPELDRINIRELEVKTKDVTFDAKNTNNQEPIFTSVEVEPRFKGGMASFYTYLQQNLVYPNNAVKRRLEGKVFIGFIVEKDGALTNIKILRGVSPEIDAEAGRVISSSPKWLPGLQNEKPVRVQYVVPITFKLPPDAILSQQLLRDSLKDLSSDHKIFSAVDQAPSFPDDMGKFYKFLQNNVRYPADAAMKNVQGKVFLTFVVEKDGSLTDIRVLRGIGSGCDEEAVRVLKLSPKWNPGMQNNRPVRVQYTMPISFALEKR